MRGKTPCSDQGNQYMTEAPKEPQIIPSSGGFDLNGPTIVGLLIIASYFTVISGIVAVVLCYVWKGENREEWEKSHYEYHIRTFWGALIGTVISFILMLVLIGFLLILAVAIWTIIRVVMSMINAQKREPMPNPFTLGF
jgi:uncharacterized membrane protein